MPRDLHHALLHLVGELGLVVERTKTGEEIGRIVIGAMRHGEQAEYEQVDLCVDRVDEIR